jgi:hypothetical protein
MCKIWYRNNLKMRLTALLFDPPTRAPYRGMMEENDLFPPSAQFQHYLCALALMRTYPPNDATLSRLLGGRNPNTVHKYMRPFIQFQSFSELEYFDVSNYLLCNTLITKLYSTTLPHTRFSFKRGRKMMP